MKKFIVSLLVVVCCFGYPAIAKTPKYNIAFATLSTEGGFMAMLAKGLKDRFEKAGHKFEIASCDFNPVKQIEQIENFMSQGVDEIIIMAVVPSSLSDVIHRARSQGIKIVAFSTETEEYDVYLGADDFALGKTEAEMAADWIDKTFPNALAGSVNVAIFENRDKPMAAKRSDGFREISKLTPKAKIVETVSVDTSPKGGQAAAENLILTNPDVNVILSFNADTASGVDAYAMSMSSAIKDKSHFATFSIDFNPPAAAAIKASADNKSIWRGTVQLGGSLDQLFSDVFNNSIAALEGTLKQKQIFAELHKITPENVPDMGGH